MASKPHIFIHDKILNALIVRFIPQRVQPNHVTILRMILTPIIFFLILKERYVIGVPLFVFAALTDAIDGTMARVRNKITQWGIMMDPLADKFLIGSILILLAVQYVHPLLVYAIIGIEVAFIVSASIHKYRGGQAKMANLWGKIKMLLQVIAVFLILLGLLIDYPVFIHTASFVFGGALVFAIMSLFRHGV